MIQSLDCSGINTLTEQILEHLAALKHLSMLGVRVEDGQGDEMLSRLARLTRLTNIEIHFAEVSPHS